MFLGYLILVLPVVAFLSLISYLPVYVYMRKKVGKRPFIRHLTIYACFGVIWSILYITIFSFGFPIRFVNEYHFLNLIPFIWVKETYGMGFTKMMEQLVMNIIMLIPLGIFLPSVFSSLRKLWRTTLPIVLFVIGIETFQYFIGRSADIDDLIMNTLGGMLGYEIFGCMNQFFFKKKWWCNALDIKI